MWNPRELRCGAWSSDLFLLVTVMILEFRIPLPITVDDFQVAQLAMVIKAQEKVTGGGEGIVVLKNEP